MRLRLWVRGAYVAVDDVVVGLVLEVFGFLGCLKIGCWDPFFEGFNVRNVEEEEKEEEEDGDKVKS